MHVWKGKQEKPVGEAYARLVLPEALRIFRKTVHLSPTSCFHTPKPNLRNNAALLAFIHANEPAFA